MPRILLLALVLALPGPLGAQVGPPSSTEGRVTSAAALVLKGGELAGVGRAHLGGWAGLVFGERLLVGGGGFTLTDAVERPGTLAGTGFDLGMGYGGVLVRYWHPLPRGLTGELGLLLGGGNADLTDRLQVIEPRSDNFFLVEPEVGLTYPLPRGFHAGLSLGYRKAWGVEDLPTVSSGDLSSLTGTLTLRLGGM